MSASTKSSDNMADKILKKLKSLDEQLTSLIKLNSEKIGQLLNVLKEVKGKDKEIAETKLKELQTELDKVTTTLEKTKQDNENLENQLSQLKEIDKQVGELETTVKSLSVNNTGVENQIKNLTSPTTGGFQYNKKHPKHKRPSR